MRFGVIGCGTIAYWSHLRALKSLRDAKVTAVADPDPQACVRAQRLCGAAGCSSAEELLDRGDVDAVVISAPTALHAALGIAAARAGKHVYIEKPLATSAAEAETLIAAVRQARVFAAVGFNRRFHPLAQLAREIIAAGRIGEVRAVLSTFCEPNADSAPAWKRARATGGGVLLDLASHHIDLLRWVLGQEPAVAAASIASRAMEDDTAWLHLNFNGGVEAHSYFSLSAARADYVDFIGEHATLRFDRHRMALSLRESRRRGYGVRSGWVAPSGDVLRWWPRRIVSPSFDPSFRTALAAFAQQSSVTLASLDDGLANLKLILDAERIAGRPCAS